jgi:hypothetical protein
VFGHKRVYNGICIVWVDGGKRKRLNKDGINHILVINLTFQ